MSPVVLQWRQGAIKPPPAKNHLGGGDYTKKTKWANIVLHLETVSPLTNLMGVRKGDNLLSYHPL